MKGFSWRGWGRDEVRRYPAACVAGLLLALAFPTPGVAGFAWVGPGLLLFSGIGLERAAAFRVGYAAGLVQALVSLRWLLHIPHPAGAVAGWLALSAYLAVYPGLWLLASSAWVAGRSGPGAGGMAGGWRGALGAYAAIPWIRRVMVPVGVAAFWVALEMIRGRFLSGFPWNLLGTSQWRQAPLIQMAGVTGVYGLSFLVCWMSAALAGSLVMVAFRPQDRFAWMAEARLPLLTLLIALGTGFYRIMEVRRSEASSAPRMATIALIQPSIPQTLLWDPSERGRSFAVASRLTGAALATRPDALIWPEGNFGVDAAGFRTIAGQVEAAGAAWVFSGIDSDGEKDERVYNAAFLARAMGGVETVYRKRRLVIFGEYVPLVRWLPFLRHLTPIGDGFESGDRPVRFELGRGTNGVVAAPLICFEDVFPHGVAEHAGPGTDFLLELTNDGWFGRSAAQWQHLANVVMRAVENGIPIVRSTNNGVTCWVDSLGVVRDTLGQGGAAGGEYGEGFLTIRVPVGTGRQGDTLYRRHGDLFGWVCVAYAAVAWTGLLRRRGAGTG